MRGGVRPAKTRHVVVPSPLERDSHSPQGMGQIREDRCNSSVAQWALRAGGRNWVDGRIAECPRLQQIAGSHP
jgi:hypothetical protein